MSNCRSSTGDELQKDQVQIPLCMDEEQKEHEVVDSLRVDDVKDRVYKHPLKNRKLKVLFLFISNLCL